MKLQRLVLPLTDGEHFTMEFPYPLSEESWQDIAEYMELFFRRTKRRLNENHKKEPAP